MICPIIDILNQGKILICDELEASLHESVIFQIVQLFQHYQKDKFAQLIFSTHDTSLLDTDLFRRDQVWFTQLNTKERATDLYSLVEIKNVRKTERIDTAATVRHRHPSSHRSQNHCERDSESRS